MKETMIWQWGRVPEIQGGYILVAVVECWRGKYLSVYPTSGITDRYSVAHRESGCALTTWSFKYDAAVELAKKLDVLPWDVTGQDAADSLRDKMQIIIHAAVDAILAIEEGGCVRNYIPLERVALHSDKSSPPYFSDVLDLLCELARMNYRYDADCAEFHPEPDLEANDNAGCELLTLLEKSGMVEILKYPGSRRLFARWAEKGLK